MEKQYSIKIYELDGTYKKTTNPRDLVNDISYTATINWGQGQMQVILNLPFNNTDFEVNNIIKVFETDENNQNWRLIYSWVITQLNRQLDVSGEIITLTALWLYSLLSFIYYYSWSYSFNETDDPANILKNIIDYFNTKYTANRLSYWSNVDTYGTTVNIDFEYDKCLKAFETVQKTTDFYYFIDASWELFFKNKPTTPTHTFTVWTNINYLSVKADKEKLVNEYILKRKSWTTTYSDAKSKTNNWLR